MPRYTFSIPSIGLVCEAYPADEPFVAYAPQYRRVVLMNTPDPQPEVIREDVQEAIIDALAMTHPRGWRILPDEWEILGMSDPVALAPLELEF